MANESSPNFACGQVIFNLKMSKLNYVVKETPYSAYITIRKKFKSSGDKIQDPSIVATANNKLRNVEMALESMRIKNEELEREIGLSKVDFEELEVKYEALEKENSKSEDTIEECFADNRKLKQKLEISEMSNSELSLRLEEAHQRNSVSIKDFEKHKKVESKKYLEKCDLVDILESTLDNNKLEIQRLREELENAHKQLNAKEYVYQYACDLCDFVNSSETILKEHVKRNHEYKCEICDLVVKTKHKLNNHMCRIYLKNPEYNNFYIKNWIVNKSCSIIYSNILRNEFAVFHSDECFSMSPRSSCCQDLPEEFYSGASKIGSEISDYNEVMHFQLTKYIQNGEVNWPVLSKKMRSMRPKIT